MHPLRVFIGYDPREAVAFHVCANSIIRHASVPVSIQPLALNTVRKFYNELHTDGSNQFIYQRFLVPYLCGFEGPALFVDGDMLVKDDVAKLFALLRNDVDVAVVKHDYKTKHPVKYFGQKNEDYEKKNWSSVILWNCGSFPNRVLTPEFVATQTGSFLHRFQWLKDERIQELPLAWNFLVEESPIADGDGAKLLHFTIGVPAIPEFEDCDFCEEWWEEHDLSTRIQG